MFYKIDICNYVKVIKSGLVIIEYFKILMLKCWGMDKIIGIYFIWFRGWFRSYVFY